MDDYERITISISKDDKSRLNDLKSVFNEKTYSKVVQILIRYSK